jgi:hypothetical protein
MFTAAFVSYWITRNVLSSYRRITVSAEPSRVHPGSTLSPSSCAFDETTVLEHRHRSEPLIRDGVRSREFQGELGEEEDHDEEISQDLSGQATRIRRATQLAKAMRFCPKSAESVLAFCADMFWPEQSGGQCMELAAHRKNPTKNSGRRNLSSS